ncbi:hypothetical protein M8J75_012726 [Diaphorina citri]|nr:hypothetical protein M8J75_012726 [Diaphorina citri]
MKKSQGSSLTVFLGTDYMLGYETRPEILQNQTIRPVNTPKDKAPSEATFRGMEFLVYKSNSVFHFPCSNVGFVSILSFLFLFQTRPHPRPHSEAWNKAPSEATFRGLEFLVYDQTRIGGEPIISSQDTISLYFRTKHSTGLILHAGMYITSDGGVAINLKLAMGKLDMYIRPNRLRFDDNQWHHLSIHRRIQEISSPTTLLLAPIALTLDLLPYYYLPLPFL